MLVPMVDCIFADVAQPDQSRIVALNASLYLKQGGGTLISIKANCIDSTAPPEQVFASEVEKLKAERFYPKEQLTLGTKTGSPRRRGKQRLTEPRTVRARPRPRGGRLSAAGICGLEDAAGSRDCGEGFRKDIGRHYA